jgi:hypothetical protein
MRSHNIETMNLQTIHHRDTETRIKSETNHFHDGQVALVRVVFLCVSVSLW